MTPPRTPPPMTPPRPARLARRDNHTQTNKAAFDRLEVDRTLGKRLKLIREERGYTISDVARLTKIEARELVRMELGAMGIRASYKRRFSALFEVPSETWDSRYEDEATLLERQGPV